jgi:hypothetical protein
MSRNRRNKPATRSFQVCSKLALTLVTICAVPYLSLLALTYVMRIKRVNDTMRVLSSKMGKREGLPIRKIAGTRLGSLYFNLSILKHVGRRSGHTYETYLAAYPCGDGFMLALAYPKVDWCSNIMASGTCMLIYKDHEYTLDKPELLPISEALHIYPLLIRPFLLAGGMKQCLWVHRQQTPTEEKVPESSLAQK